MSSKVERTEQKAYIPPVQPVVASGAVSAALGAGAGSAGSAAGLSGRMSLTSGSSEVEHVETLNFAQAVRGWQREQSLTAMRVGAGQLGLTAGSGQDLLPAYEKRVLELYVAAALAVGVEPVEKPTVSDAVDLLAGLEAPDEEGLNALHHAIVEGQIEELQDLIELGMDVNGLTSEATPEHPLGLALLLANNEPDKSRLAVAALLKAGANPNSVFRAILFDGGDLEALEQLLQARADVEARDDGLTPLMEICCEGSRLIPGAQRLLKYGAEINAMDEKTGSTALHFAVQTDIDLVRFLLNAGADPYQVNTPGLSPLEVAEKKGVQEIVALLQGIQKKPGAGAGAGQQSAGELPPSGAA
jgi:hypothetical protein